jgi:hypothetical protein
VARVGVSVVKSFSFRGVAQEFSNTYYYETTLGVLEGTAISLIDAVVALERPMHSSSVTFVRARCWSAGGTKQENQMLAQKQLSGAGTNSNGPLSSMDRERAFLVRFRAGNDTKGRPVYLRKWWHLDVGVIATDNLGTGGVLQNTAQLGSAARSQLVTWGNQFKSVQVGPQEFSLVSEKGRNIDGPTVAHPYLEHHQLGDMWRG